MSEWSAARTQQHTEMTELPWVQRSRRRSNGADAAEQELGGEGVVVEDETTVWEQLAGLLRLEEWQHLSIEHIGQAARLSFVAALAGWSQMHDLHELFPLAPLQRHSLVQR